MNLHQITAETDDDAVGFYKNILWQMRMNYILIFIKSENIYVK